MVRHLTVGSAADIVIREASGAMAGVTVLLGEEKLLLHLSIRFRVLRGGGVLGVAAPKASHATGGWGVQGSF